MFQNRDYGTGKVLRKLDQRIILQIFKSTWVWDVCWFSGLFNLIAEIVKEIFLLILFADRKALFAPLPQ